MRYRALDENGDYTFGQGSTNFLINSPAAVGQAVGTRLDQAAGTWFLDNTRVTPYDEILGEGTFWTADPAIQGVVLDTVVMNSQGAIVNGVTAIKNYSSEVVGRKRSVGFNIDTVFGPIPFKKVLG